MGVGLLHRPKSPVSFLDPVWYFVAQYTVRLSLSGVCFRSLFNALTFICTIIARSIAAVVQVVVTASVCFQTVKYIWKFRVLIFTKGGEVVGCGLEKSWSNSGRLELGWDLGSCGRQRWKFKVEFGKPITAQCGIGKFRSMWMWHACGDVHCTYRVPCLLLKFTVGLGLLWYLFNFRDQFLTYFAIGCQHHQNMRSSTVCSCQSCMYELSPLLFLFYFPWLLLFFSDFVSVR